MSQKNTVSQRSTKQWSIISGWSPYTASTEQKLLSLLFISSWDIHTRGIGQESGVLGGNVPTSQKKSKLYEPEP